MKMETQFQNKPETPLDDSNYSEQEKDENTPDSQVYLSMDDDQLPQKVPGVTKSIHKFKSMKKKYHTISDDNRMKLIDAVENKGEKIKHAAKRLCINYSSAKSICQVFKREGRTNKKTYKRRGAKEELGNDFKTEIGFTAAITDLSNQDLGCGVIEVSDPFSSDSNLVPEKDTLKILRDRLLESRASRLKQQSYQNDQDLSIIGPKSHNVPSQQSNPMYSQLQQLEDVINQNKRLLGEDSNIWMNNYSHVNPQNQPLNQPVYSSIPDSFSAENSQIVASNYIQQNNGFSMQMVNMDQLQTRNMNIQNLNILESNSGFITPQSLQQNTIYAQAFQNNQQQQQFYFISQNQNLGANQVPNQFFAPNNQQQSGQIPIYQPMVYYISQSPQLHPNSFSYVKPQSSLLHAKDNNLMKQNYPLFQKSFDNNLIFLKAGGQNQENLSNLRQNQ